MCNLEYVFVLGPQSSDSGLDERDFQANEIEHAQQTRILISDVLQWCAGSQSVGFLMVRWLNKQGMLRFP